MRTRHRRAASRSPSSGETPPQRLVDAAIQEIERHGLGQLTVRGVAAAAGMNVAAVNYYFRSKAALVATALESSIQHLVEDSNDLLSRMPEDPIRVLGELLTYYLEGSLRFPRLVKAHVHGIFVDESCSGPFPRLFSPVVNRLAQAIHAAVPGLDQPGAGRRAVAALSAVFFPAFFRELFQPLDALETPGDRWSYVQEVARSALTPAPAPGLSSQPPPPIEEPRRTDREANAIVLPASSAS